jgi:hypothetical protein
MRTWRVVLPIVVVAAVLFVQGSRASAQQSTSAAQPQTSVQSPTTAPQAAPTMKTPLMQALEAASKPQITKKRSGLSFPKSRDGRRTAAAGSCDIYCGNGSSIGVPAETIEDCACACVSYCGGISCTDLDTGFEYYC